MVKCRGTGCATANRAKPGAINIDAGGNIIAPYFGGVR
jgi:hypothetical protein